MRSTLSPKRKRTLLVAVTCGLTAALLLARPDQSVSTATVAAKSTVPPLTATTTAPAPATTRATTSATNPATNPAAASVTTPATNSSAAAAPSAHKPVFVIYYLWWSASHWQDRLGGQYAANGRSAPLPATLDATGCGARAAYSGDKLTDVPAAGPSGYDQTDPAVIERDVRTAAALGVKGFTVNWNGAGTSNQTLTSSPYNARLQYVFDAVHKLNAEGTPFKIMLNYKASTTILSSAAITGDLTYFAQRYGADPALDHSYSPRPEVIWTGSWKYSAAQLAAVSSAVRGTTYLIGDEKPSTWSAARGAQLDGASYYWSSQDPWNNPSSFGQVKKLGDAVHAATNPDGRAKTWLAPFTPGYNAQLLYGTSTCVPRNNGQTMHALFRGNLASRPDGWMFISWNEIAEGSYIVPLSRYGQQYTSALQSVIANNG